jgi:hypothetical protein
MVGQCGINLTPRGFLLSGKPNRASLMLPIMELSDPNKKEQGPNLPCSFNINGRKKILSNGKGRFLKKSGTLKKAESSFSELRKENVLHPHVGTMEVLTCFL